ncbi:MAG TPA: hypothetical protein VGJ15_11730 [Pirellulales bacterium]|jgi:hypothetical protein
MTDLLQEFCDSRGAALRVDRTAGVIRGIKILGHHSRNRREYLPEALARAASLYEGAKVNVNHPKGHPHSPRDYQERMGVIRNVQHRAGEGLFADFHFNPKHYLSEQLIWDAEHTPENVGFSHNVQARTSRRGEATVVEEIIRVHSVDLVADPATTRGLFEAAAVETDATVETGAVHIGTSGNSAAGGTELELAALSAAAASAGSGDEAGEIVESAAIVETRLQTIDRLQRLCEAQAAELVGLRREIDSLRAGEAAQLRRAKAMALLAEYRLPQPDAADAAAKAIVSEVFLQSLLSAADDAAMRRLVVERARLVGSARQWTGASARTAGPVARDQYVAESAPANSGKSFARAITN